jgi:cyclophilin family peptidyl-prolyl cis-trans isomerase
VKKIIILMVIAFFSVIPSAGAGDPSSQVRLETTSGIMVLQLYPERAPKTVENFLRYVETGFYDNTIFHRVIRGFMIQGGGLTPDMQKKENSEAVPNEADNGLKNRRGTIAMARTMDPHSATAQFFINAKDNAFLDHKGKTSQGWGYCVFGKLVEGMAVLDTIEGVKTTVREGRRDVPVDPVIILKAVVVPGKG